MITYWGGGVSKYVNKWTLKSNEFVASIIRRNNRVALNLFSIFHHSGVKKKKKSTICLYRPNDIIPQPTHMSQHSPPVEHTHLPKKKSITPKSFGSLLSLPHAVILSNCTRWWTTQVKKLSSIVIFFFFSFPELKQHKLLIRSTAFGITGIFVFST